VSRFSEVTSNRFPTCSIISRPGASFGPRWGGLSPRT